MWKHLWHTLPFQQLSEFRRKKGLVEFTPTSPGCQHVCRTHYQIAASQEHEQSTVPVRRWCWWAQATQVRCHCWWTPQQHAVPKQTGTASYALLRSRCGLSSARAAVPNACVHLTMEMHFHGHAGKITEQNLLAGRCGLLWTSLHERMNLLSYKPLVSMSAVTPIIAWAQASGAGRTLAWKQRDAARSTMPGPAIGHCYLWNPRQKPGHTQGLWSRSASWGMQPGYAWPETIYYLLEGCSLAVFLPSVKYSEKSGTKVLFYLDNVPSWRTATEQEVVKWEVTQCLWIIHEVLAHISPFQLQPLKAGLSLLSLDVPSGTQMTFTAFEL